MDLDASLKSHGNRLSAIEGFIAEVKGLMSGTGGNAEHATDKLDELLAFKSEIEGALPEIRKAVSDTEMLVADLAALKMQLAPVLAWVAEQQKAAEAAKAAEPVHDAAVDEAEHEPGWALPTAETADTSAQTEHVEVEPAAS